MFSILNEIKQYIDEKGIPFNSISVGYNCFPSHYNQAILNHIRKLTGNIYDMGASEYTISFDKNGSIYLLVHDSHKKTNLCIANTRLSLDDGIKITQVPEVDIIDEACVLKLLSDERSMIREMINNNYPNLSMLDKVKLENNIINTLVAKKFKELSNNHENILDSVPYNDEMQVSIDNITEYIDYLNDYYLEVLNQEEDDQMEGIYYSEPDSDHIFRRSTNKGYNQKQERNNPIIPANDRIDVLNRYEYLYREYAYTSDVNKIEYLNYLYKIGEGEYVLIMEPYNGNKFTKMAIIKSTDEISKEEFDELVRHYLELSYQDFDLSGNTIKSNHTSLTTYEQIIDYVITGSNKKVTNTYFKDKIKRIKRQ